MGMFPSSIGKFPTGTLQCRRELSLIQGTP
jgi:hypothetical protein